MRDRCDAEVLASLERELSGDPVVHDLAARLARSGGRDGSLPRARADRRPALLAVGLAVMLLGCVVLSPVIAVAGAVVSVAALVPTPGSWTTFHHTAGSQPRCGGPAARET